MFWISQNVNRPFFSCAILLSIMFIMSSHETVGVSYPHPSLSPYLVVLLCIVGGLIHWCSVLCKARVSRRVVACRLDCLHLNRQVALLLLSWAIWAFMPLPTGAMAEAIGLNCPQNPVLSEPPYVSPFHSCRRRISFFVTLWGSGICIALGLMWVLLLELIASRLSITSF